MTLSLILSGLFISCLGAVLIYYAKAMSRFSPAIIGAVMCIYPFFIFNLYWLWGITVALLVLLYLLREKD